MKSRVCGPHLQPQASMALSLPPCPSPLAPGTGGTLSSLQVNKDQQSSELIANLFCQQCKQCRWRHPHLHLGRQVGLWEMESWQPRYFTPSFIPLVDTRCTTTSSHCSYTPLEMDYPVAEGLKAGIWLNTCLSVLCLTLLSSAAHADH